ncbi:MAG: PAS domain S-box protein [Methanoregula sp.]|jgi:PAS domain S-box-containing protein
MGSPAELPIEQRVAALCGIITVFVAIAGLFGIAWGYTTLASLAPGYKSVSLFAAAAWIVLGGILCFHALRPLAGLARTIAAAACAAISLIGLIEFPLLLFGIQTVVEGTAMNVGDRLLGRPTSVMSPLMAGLFALLAIAVFILLYATPDRRHHTADLSAVGLLGAGIFTVGFTLLLSYFYGSPLLYGITIAPTSYTSALAACSLGIGLMAAAGPDAYPLRYFYGTSTRALILRTFLPLTLVIIFIQDLFILRLEHLYGINDTLLLAVSLVLFCILSLLIVAFTSKKLGDLVDRAEEEVRRKNDALNAAYEQLAASDEELRRQYDELAEQGKKLMESEDRNRELATLLEHSSQPFAVGYPDGRLAMFNHAFSELTGYSSDELERIYWSAVLTPPEWKAKEAEALETLNRTGGPVRYEKEYIRKDASKVPIELFVHLIRDKQGNPSRYYSFITDITERKKAEFLLRQSEKRFRALVRNSSDIIRILDASGHISYESPSSATILGYPEGELNGKSPIGLVHPDDRDRVRKGFSRVLSGTNPGTPTEFRARKADGTYIYVESIGANLLNVPEVAGIVMTIHPIDDRKRAALALAKSEEKFRLLADFAYDWEYWISPEGTFVYVSPSCERITGYTADEFMADPGIFGKIVHENDRDLIGDHLSSISEEPPFHSSEFRIHKKSGEICWIGHTCHAIYDADGRWIGRRASNQDITKRREAEEEIKKREEDLHAAYEELTASDEELRENYEELAKSQDALRESNRRLTEAQELAHLGFWEWDVRTGQVTWSDEVFTIFRLDPATFTPQIDSILALSPWPEEQQRGRELIQRATVSHLPGTYEQRFLLPDKSVGYYHSTFEGRYDNAGTLVTIVGTVLDITERKKADLALRDKHRELNAAYEQLTATEEELRQNYEELAKSEQNLRASEQRLRRFYDAGLIGVIQWNTAEKITAANDKFLSMTGYTRDDLVAGRINWAAMTPPEFHERDKIALAELKENGFNKEPYEKENIKKDGTRLPILVAAAMLDDQFSEGVAFILDISARKQAEAERETFAQQRELALRAAHLGWWHYDPVTKISTYDKRYTEIFGVTGNSGPNEEFLALLHPDDLPRVLAAVDAALNPADPQQYAIEYRVNAKDGVMRWVWATGLATFSGNGPLRHAASFVGTVEDITARKNEERALRLVNQKLQLMNIVAWHDIQNKVTGLRGYVELSRDLVADENVKKMLRAEESILKVIHQQLEYTREYQKIGEKPSEWVDIRAMLSMVLALKSIRSVQVEINVDGLFVYTDPILEKVFSHLIENTLVHAKTATEIRIGYRETAEGLVLVYEDNGPGIAQADKESLFVRTFATTHFGLFFIHDILELSGIGFTETGEPGKGVRFGMAIPRGMYRIDPQPGSGA